MPKDRRYFREPYPHRWVIRNGQGVLVAHIGVHEKEVETEGTTFHIGGICEVACIISNDFVRSPNDNEAFGFCLENES